MAPRIGGFAGHAASSSIKRWVCLLPRPGLPDAHEASRPIYHFPALGWVAVVATPQLFARLGVAGGLLLVAGGLIYSAGAAVYALRRPDPCRRCSATTGKVRTGLAVSLDGFISGPNDGPDAPMGHGGERLLAWYAAGDTECAGLCC